MKTVSFALLLALSLFAFRMDALSQTGEKVQAKTGLWEDFESEKILKNISIAYAGKVAHPSKRARRYIKDGVLIAEGDFGPDSGANDTVKLRWGSVSRKSARFAPVDLKEYPILELRTRSGTGESFRFPLFIGFQRQNGAYEYVYVHVHAGAPKDPRKWNTHRLRIAADSVAPTAYTPRQIIGLQVFL